MRHFYAIVLVGVLTCAARADEFTLRSGEKVAGDVLGETDEVYMVKVDGKTRSIKKTDVSERVETPKAPKKKDAPTDGAAAVHSATAGAQLLKSLLPEALAWADKKHEEIWTGRPEKTDSGSFLVHPPREKLTVEHAVYFDEPVEQLIEEAWKARGDTKESRFRVQQKYAGAICWAKFQVEGCEKYWDGSCIVAKLKFKSKHRGLQAYASLPTASELKIDSEVRGVVAIAVDTTLFESFLKIDEKREREAFEFTNPTCPVDYPFLVQPIYLAPEKGN